MIQNPRQLFAAQFPNFRLEQMAVTVVGIELTLVSIQPNPTCPVCGSGNPRRHSRYRRKVIDLPWSGSLLRLHLQVRRFRCTVQTCPRKVFTERLPALIAPYARRTSRPQEVLNAVGMALSGEAGARLSAQLHIPASASTRRRSIRRTAPGQREVPRVIGIDDFAFRRGQRYGTLIVDLEGRRPIALLPDQSATTLASWLKAHPQVETICRDRSTEYARGIVMAAPSAVQVADRSHLLKNLQRSP